MKTFSITFNSEIDSVVYEPEKVPPILLNVPPEDNIQVEKLEGGLYYNKRKRKNVVAFESEDRVYKSSSEIKTDKSTFLVIFNKKTKKVRLVHANELELNVLNPQDVEEYKDIKEDEVENEQKGYNDSISELVEAFGSKKMKNQHKVKQALEINLDSFKDYIEQNIHSIKTDLEPPAAETESEISQAFLPPCDESATELKNVYKIRDLIPRDVLEMLYDPAKELLQKGSFDEENSYFNDLLKNVTKPKRTKKAAILIYLRTLLDWLGMEARLAVTPTIVEKKYQLPMKVVMHLIRSFSIVAKRGRLRPNTMKAKAVTHGIVLNLALSNYSINAVEYMKSCNTRLGLGKFKELCRLLRLTQDVKNRNFWNLKLPLPPEKSAMKQAKGSRSVAA